MVSRSFSMTSEDFLGIPEIEAVWVLKSQSLRKNVSQTVPAKQLEKETSPFRLAPVVILLKHPLNTGLTVPQPGES